MRKRKPTEAEAPQTSKTPTITTLIEWTLERRLINEGLLCVRYAAGQGPLCLVLGDNATGKSFVRRIISVAAKEHKVEAIPLSMEARAGSDGMWGMKGFVYGDESWKSTGHNSANTIASMMSTSQKREKPHTVYLDEPDTGLSDRWARSMGRELAKFLTIPPPHLTGLFITTHRTALVRELLSLHPHVMLVGEGWPATLDEWLAGDSREVEPLDALGERGITLFRRINDVTSKWKDDK